MDNNYNTSKKRGRPKKYDSPIITVTILLPQDVLEFANRQMKELNLSRGEYITRCIQQSNPEYLMKAMKYSQRKEQEELNQTTHKEKIDKVKEEREKLIGKRFCPACNKITPRPDEKGGQLFCVHCKNKGITIPFKILTLEDVKKFQKNDRGEWRYVV